jgi:hypothetical protein
VHAMVTQMLIGWYAEAAGQTRGEVLQRLTLTLGTWLDDPGAALGAVTGHAPLWCPTPEAVPCRHMTGLAGVHLTVV